MNRPAQKEKPQDCREAELNHCHCHTPLEQLSQPGYEEAAQCSDDVPCGSLAGHRSSCLVSVQYTAVTETGDCGLRTLPDPGLKAIDDRRLSANSDICESRTQVDRAKVVLRPHMFEFALSRRLSIVVLNPQPSAASSNAESSNAESSNVVNVPSLAYTSRLHKKANEPTLFPVECQIWTPKPQPQPARR